MPLPSAKTSAQILVYFLYLVTVLVRPFKGSESSIEKSLGLLSNITKFLKPQKALHILNLQLKIGAVLMVQGSGLV